MRYCGESKRKASGVVYTPSDMADFVAAEMIRHQQSTAKYVSILDPATGRGSLLIALIKALRKCGKTVHAVGYETDADTGRKTKQYLSQMFPDVTVDIRIGDFLEAAGDGTAGQYDYVIANPPYIRTQIMGSSRAQAIAEKLSLTGRADLYYAFIVCAKNVLKENGTAGCITSNKFMTIKAGAAVRKFVLKNYMVHRIVDLGDTKLFDASVLPCIMFFSNCKDDADAAIPFTSVYQSNDAAADAVPAASIFEKIEESGYYRVPDGRVFRFQQGTLNCPDTESVWTLSLYENEQWLARVASNTWLTFSQIGKIRVGIKTTADNVFIGGKWEGELSELELLRPLITHRNAGQIVANNDAQWKVLYTHYTKNGKKVPYSLEDYPKTRQYLESHYAQLAAREYVKKAHRKWYEIWVPQNPDAWMHEKIVFRDISEKPEFWLDATGAVVNGDCYWIDIAPGTPEDTVYLALAVANSTFIEKFYDVRFNTKLYSGKRRYQTQYVGQFPIPYYGRTEARQLIDIVKKLVAEGSRESVTSCKPQMDALVEKLFSA